MPLAAKTAALKAAEVWIKVNGFVDAVGEPLARDVVVEDFDVVDVHGFVPNPMVDGTGLLAAGHPVQVYG